jgi:hypothetical protein
MQKTPDRDRRVIHEFRARFHLLIHKISRRDGAPTIKGERRAGKYLPARRLYCASDCSSSRMYSITASLQPSMCAHAP